MEKLIDSVSAEVSLIEDSLERKLEKRGRRRPGRRRPGTKDKYANLLMTMRAMNEQTLDLKRKIVDELVPLRDRYIEQSDEIKSQLKFQSELNSLARGALDCVG